MLLPLKAAGFPCWEQARGAECSQMPPLLGLCWLVSKVFQRFFYYPKERKLTTKHQKTPKAIWCRSLSISSTWPFRKSSCASGRNLRSGHQRPRMPPAPASAPGLGSGEGGQQVGEAAFLSTQWGLEQRGRLVGRGGHQGPPLPTALRVPTPCLYLQQVAVAIGPRAEAQGPSPEPSGRSQPPGRNGRCGMGEKQPLEQRRGFHVEILPLPVMSSETGG